METVKYLGKQLPALVKGPDFVALGQGTDHYKRGLGLNVFEAAKERARYIFNRFDEVTVSFSGGKDSLVVLELMEMVRIEMGIEKKLNVIFYDEEVLPDSVINFISDYYHSGRFNFYWYCVPLISEKYVMGKKARYIQWDEGRKWVRPKPEWSLGVDSLIGFKDPVDQSQLAQYYIHNFPGSVCINLGLRAQESLNRLKAVLRSNNKEYPFLTSSGTVGRVTEAKIIYDWRESDVFKFFYDFDIKYCQIYDHQAWIRKTSKSNGTYRVATPLRSESSHISQLKKYEPEFYDRIIQVWPDMINHERYFLEYDRDAVMFRYGITPEGIAAFINDTYSGSIQDLAYKVLNSALALKKKSLANGDELGCMPLLYVFKCFVRGSFKRGLNRLPVEDITDKMRQYENYLPETEERIS